MDLKPNKRSGKLEPVLSVADRQRMQASLEADDFENDDDTEYFEDHLRDP